MLVYISLSKWKINNMITEVSNFFDILMLYDDEYENILPLMFVNNSVSVNLEDIFSCTTQFDEILYNSNYNSADHKEYLTEIFLACDVALLDFIAMILLSGVKN